MLLLWPPASYIATSMARGSYSNLVCQIRHQPSKPQPPSLAWASSHSASVPITGSGISPLPLSPLELFAGPLAPCSAQTQGVPQAPLCGLHTIPTATTWSSSNLNTRCKHKPFQPSYMLMPSPWVSVYRKLCTANSSLCCQLPYSHS